MMKKIILSLLIFFSFGFLNNIFASDTLSRSVNNVVDIENFGNDYFYVVQEYRTINFFNSANSLIHSYNTNTHISNFRKIENDDFILYSVTYPYNGGYAKYFYIIYNKKLNTFINSASNFFPYGSGGDSYTGIYNGNIVFDGKILTKNTDGTHLISSFSQNSQIKLIRYGNYICSSGDKSSDYICYYRDGNNLKYDFYTFDGTVQSFFENTFSFKNSLSLPILSHKYSFFTKDGKKYFLLSLVLDDNGLNKYSTYSYDLNTKKLDIFKDDFLILGLLESIYGFNSLENSISSYNGVSLFSFKKVSENIVFGYYSGNSIYNNLSDFDPSTIFSSSSSSSSSKNCKTLSVNYPKKFTLVGNDLSLISQELDLENNRGVINFTSKTQSGQYSVILQNADNLNGFSFSNHFLNSQPIEFDTLNTLDRLYSNKNAPILKLKSLNGKIDFFNIIGHGPLDSDYLGFPIDCETHNKLTGSEFFLNGQDLYYAKDYYPKTSNFCLKFHNGLGTHHISLISFGISQDNYIDKEVCKDIYGNITVDGEPFDGDLDNISSLESIDNIKDDGTTLVNSSTLNDVASDILDKLGPVGDFIELLNITFPDEPQTYSLNIPLLKIKADDGKLKVGAGVYQADMQKIDDRLGVSDVGEGTSNTKKFISFFLAIFYILIRFAILLLALLPIILYFKIASSFTKSILGNLLGDGKKSPGLLSLILVWTFGAIFFFTISTIASSFLDITGFLSHGVNFIDKVFGFLLSSFFDYGYFQFFVNSFFGLLLTSIPLYIALRVFK